MITFLKLLWRFRWQSISAVLALVLGVHLYVSSRDLEISDSNHQVVPTGIGAYIQVEVESEVPRDNKGNKLPQKTLECVELQYYEENSKNLGNNHQQSSEKINQVDYNPVLKQRQMENLELESAHPLEPVFLPLLERTKIEIEDIDLTFETRLDPQTHKVKNTLHQVERDTLYFPNEILLGPRFSLDEQGETLGFYLRYYPGRIGPVHFECDAEIFQYQSINDDLPEDLIDHFDGVSYEASCAALYRIH